MKNRISALAVSALLSSLLLVGSCRRPGINEYVEKLPDLPPDIAATLDAKTLATKISASFPPPEKEPGTALAPCCGRKDVKSLKVRFPYTKCGPLRDFIVGPIPTVAIDTGQGGGPSGGQGPGQANFKVYRLKRSSPKTVLDQIVCVTSDGPWNATLTEDRFCVGYTPHQTLTINAFGDTVLFVWNGGVQNHPPQVALVSCRQIAVTEFPCGGISDCQCISSTCPPEQPCECSLPW